MTDNKVYINQNGSEMVQVNRADGLGVAEIKKMGIKLINYPDWIRRGDIEQYKGLYDANLSHVKRNHKWLKDAKLENPTLIQWGVILKNFPFVKRKV